MISDYAQAAKELRDFLRNSSYAKEYEDQGMPDILSNLDWEHSRWLEDRVFDGSIKAEKSDYEEHFNQNMFV